MPDFNHSKEPLPNNWRRQANTEPSAENNNTKPERKPANLCIIKECSYCIYLEKPKEEYQSHCAVNPANHEVQCPELKMVTCSVCNQTGHSRLFCKEFSLTDDGRRQKEDIKKTANQLRQHLDSRKNVGRPPPPNPTPPPRASQRNFDSTRFRPREPRHMNPRHQFQSKSRQDEASDNRSTENTVQDAAAVQNTQADGGNGTTAQQFQRPCNNFRQGPSRGNFVPRNPHAPPFRPNNFKAVPNMPVYNGPPIYNNTQMFSNGTEYVTPVIPDMLVPPPMPGVPMQNGPMMPSFSMPQLPPPNAQYYIPTQNLQLPVMFASPYADPSWQPRPMNFGPGPYY